jgi:hypothetical protein
MGRQSRSVSAWILVVRPPRERPIACAGKRVKEVAPNALRRPPDIAIVQRLPRPVDRWSINPATPRLQHMHNAADHTTIVNPRFASRVRRKVRSNARELSFGQPEIISNHHGVLPETVNHTLLNSPTILWVLTLRRVSALHGGHTSTKNERGPRSFSSRIGSYFGKIIVKRITSRPREKRYTQGEALCRRMHIAFFTRRT